MISFLKKVANMRPFKSVNSACRRSTPLEVGTLLLLVTTVGRNAGTVVFHTFQRGVQPSGTCAMRVASKDTGRRCVERPKNRSNKRSLLDDHHHKTGGAHSRDSPETGSIGLYPFIAGTSVRLTKLDRTTQTNRTVRNVNST